MRAIIPAAGDGFRKGSTHPDYGLPAAGVKIGRSSVREGDDDQEADHDKGDRISISIKPFKPFPIHMDLH
jgi:hypothetical protein